MEDKLKLKFDEVQNGWIVTSTVNTDKELKWAVECEGGKDKVTLVDFIRNNWKDMLYETLMEAVAADNAPVVEIKLTWEKGGVRI